MRPHTVLYGGILVVEDGLFLVRIPELVPKYDLPAIVGAWPV